MNIRSLAAGLVLLFALAPSVLAQDAATFARDAQIAYEQKNYARSAELFAEAIKRGATNPTIFYNAACSAALAGDKDLAFRFLGEAVDRGWRNADHARKDADLNSLHGDPRWTAVLSRIDAAQEKYLKSINAELFKLYREDQGDRSGDMSKADWEAISKRDDARRKRVAEILAAGEAKAADDYFHAAMVFQHGDKPEDYKRAEELARKAAELDPSHMSARWLSAAAHDRYLQSMGKPQVYGTQFRMGQDGKWTLDPIDEKAVTDEERRKHGVPSLADAKRRAEEMNRKPAGN